MSEELIQIFAECTEAIEQGRLTVDECLELYPQYRSELVDLLRLSLWTKAVPQAYPSPEFRQRARKQLLARLPPRSAAANGAVSAHHLQGGTAAHPAFSPLSFWQQLQRRLEAHFTRRQLAAGLALLLILLLVGVARLEWFRDRVDGEGVIATTGEGSSAGDIEAVDETAAEEARQLPAVPAAPPAGEETPAGTEAPAGGGEPDTVASAPPDNTTFLPFLATHLRLDAQTAAVEVVAGRVEVQGADGAWTTVSRQAPAAAGQRVRTGELSQATLTFYDGSQAHLGPNTEISLDELNAMRPEEGFRTVVMTQWLGESEHSVQFRNDGGSRYEVKTPTGSGLARGTKFHVLVTPDLQARYIVTEGKVDVSGAGRTVSVTAGQVTTLQSGAAPDEPTFTISGEGEVGAVGAVWTIAGQTFQTHAHTIIKGNPQVGDLVRVDGHLLDDGGRVADRITLLRRAVNNRFSLTGEVEAMGAVWTVAGQTIILGEQAVVEADIAVGDQVQVEGVILPGGTLEARSITRLEGVPGLPFQFSGVVEAIGDSLWTISGRSISLSGQTAVDAGIAVGDVVMVRGWIQDDGTWLAREIRRQPDDLPTFAFTGVVQSIDPWQVAGIRFETRPWTVIGPEITVGTRVAVRGSILSDGTWVADSVTPLLDRLPAVVRFTGVVSSINPWVVNGLPLIVTPETAVIGNIGVGSLVVVQAQLMPNGTWAVLSIRLLYPDFGFGCLMLSSPVIGVTANAIQVRHWGGNIDRAHIHGDIQINSVVTLPLCTGWNGTVIIIGTVVIIYQPVVVIIDDGGSIPGGIPPGCKITGIGNNNPHLKCSDRGSGRGSGRSSRRS